MDGEGGGPLEGVGVLDLSAVGPGSRCSAALRDFGASVTKVGAPVAEARPEPRFFVYGAGRGMRWMRIDLRDPRGRDVFLRLAARTDVVVESFRPGVADRLGIGYGDVRAVNERVVYCAVSGYGQDGPYADRAGHDLNYLAVGGYLATQGRRGDGGPALPGATIADSAGGGLHGALSVVAALYRRTVTGDGAFLDVSTTDGVVHLMSLFLDEYLATGVESSPGSALLTGKYACYDLYRAGDGRWLAVAAIEPRFFANLCRALGLDGWINAQYDDGRQEDLRAEMASAFARRDRDDWVRELASLETCVTPVLSIAEVAEDDHLGAARGAFVEAKHHELGRFRQVGPVLAGAERPDQPLLLPDRSADTDGVLREAGLSEAEIESLRADGVVE